MGKLRKEHSYRISIIFPLKGSMSMLQPIERSSGLLINQSEEDLQHHMFLSCALFIPINKDEDVSCSEIYDIILV